MALEYRQKMIDVVADMKVKEKANEMTVSRTMLSSYIGAIRATHRTLHRRVDLHMDSVPEMKNLQ